MNFVAQTHTPPPPAGLRVLAFLTAGATFVLIAIGGLLTSKEAGLSVPDWPTTYGYHMFYFPISQWTGGVFYEHTHRLWASLVGLLTAVLAGWIWARENSGAMKWLGLGAIIATLGLMGVRTQGMFVALAFVAALVAVFSFTRLRNDPRPVRWWAAIAFSVVLVQGVLGGLRVTALKDEIGIFHGTLAQLFLVLTCALALSMTKWWEGLRRPEVAESIGGSVSLTPALSRGERETLSAARRDGPARAASPAPDTILPLPPGEGRGEGEWRVSSASGRSSSSIAAFRKLLTALALLVLAQLILGATMRHQHAGLAVPDFPLAHGRLWPATDAASVAGYNTVRKDALDPNPITAAHIYVHMTHRLGACVLLGAAVLLFVKTRRTALARFGVFWPGLILVQASLGASVVWTNKAADIATLHVVCGALALMSVSLAAVCACRSAGQGAIDAATRLPAESPSSRAANAVGPT